MINQYISIYREKEKWNICISYPKYFEISVYIIFIVTNSIDVNLNEKDEQLVKKYL